MSILTAGLTVGLKWLWHRSNRQNVSKLVIGDPKNARIIYLHIKLKVLFELSILTGGLIVGLTVDLASVKPSFSIKIHNQRPQKP